MCGVCHPSRRKLGLGGIFFTFSGVFSGKVEIIKYGLGQPGIILAFNCVGEVVFEKFVGVYDSTYCEEIEFDESFGYEFKYFDSSVGG